MRGEREDEQKKRSHKRRGNKKRGNTVCVSVCVLASLQHLLSLFKEKKYSTNLRNPFFQKNTVHLRVIRSCPPLSPKQRRDKCPISIHNPPPHSKTTCQTEYATTLTQSKKQTLTSPSPFFEPFTGPRRWYAGRTRRRLFRSTRGRPPRRAPRAPTDARQAQARGDPRSSQVRQCTHPSQIHRRS